MSFFAASSASLWVPTVRTDRMSNSEQNEQLTPERLSRIRDVFDSAIELSGVEREEYLDKECAGDPQLRTEVNEYLAALERGKETWDNPVASLLAEALSTPMADRSAGARIGQYEVTRQIGYGGMGAVYEAVRADDQFRKRVAIKFLRRGIEGDHSIRRFRHERQILANLNHRNITSLLDGGVTPDGQPYIVMEYVDGMPITHYCNEKKLDVRERIALLRQVCGAVQHAHQNLVVHRDLKPGNILVAEDGTVKLLDFGIARLLHSEATTDEMPMTQGTIRAYTPDYASPEQVLGEPVATASDIYSLGVIACELITRHRPFDIDQRNIAQLQDAILTRQPPKPSSLLTDGDVAYFGERSLSRIRWSVEGDLDSIVLQALRKEPERRYATVEQMNMDLRRYLDGLPVSAQRDSLSYRANKFIRRRKFESAAALLVAISIGAGVVASTRSAKKAEAARAVAEAERATAVLERAKTEQVNTFLSEMLSAADPANLGRDVTVVEVLRNAAADVDKRALDPEIEAQIRHTIAQTYYGLGLYDDATPHAQRAYELRKKTFGELDFRTTYSLSYVSGVAEARGEYAVAESLSRIHVSAQRSMPNPDTTELATALDNLARAIEHQGRLEEILPIKLEALSLRRSRSDSAARAAMSFTLNNLSVSYQYLGDFVKAESLAQEALEVEAGVHGDRSFQYGSLLRNYASVLDESGKKQKADSIIRLSIDVLKAVAGSDHTEYLRSVAMHAQLRYSANDMNGAITAAQEVAANIGEAIHESEPASSATLQVLGLALDSLRRFDEAGDALRKSIALRRKYLPKDHWAIASSESVLGYHLGRRGQNSEAERILTRSYEKLSAARGADAAVTRRVAIRISELMEKQNRELEAVAWRARGTADGN